MGENQDYKVERKRYFFQTGEPFDVLYVRCQHCREYLALDMNVLNVIPGFIQAVRFLFQHTACQNLIQKRLKHYTQRVPVEQLEESPGDADIPAAI